MRLVRRLRLWWVTGPGRWLRSRFGSRAALLRLAPYALALLAAGASVLALLPAPATDLTPSKADYVIVVGIAGLRWEDVDRTGTPALWKLAEQGTIGALSVRSASEITCPADGWLTLGSGNRARWLDTADENVSGYCPDLDASVEEGTAGGGYLTQQHDVVGYNQELAWGVQPGALAEAVRCSTAIGTGAAIAVARPFGRIDQYQPTVSGDLAATLRACSLSVVDAGTVSGTDAQRQAAAAAVDQLLATVLAARPEHSLVIVAGLSDTAEMGRLHVAVADGPGYHSGWLMSSTTSRPGYLQLVDLAPTVLGVLDRPVPEKLMSGTAVVRQGDRPGKLADAVARLSDADQQGGVQRVVAGRFLTTLAVWQILLFLGVIPVLHRVRRRPGGQQRKVLSPRVRLVTETMLVAAALAIPAALIADLVPWWRLRPASLVFICATLTVLALLTCGVMLVIRRQRVAGPIGVGAAVAAAAVAADVMTGSRLQLNGVAGYSAATSGRYAGLGTIGLGVLVAGLLLVSGAVATRVPRQWRFCVVAALSSLGIVVVGSPYFGADAAGAVALSAGGCLAASAAAGGWLTSSRVFSALVTVLAVTTGFAMLDLTRPAQRRSNIGRLILDLGDGSGDLAGERVGAHNVTTIATSPLTLLVIASLAFTWFVLIAPYGGLRRLFGLYPALRATFGGMWAATLFAGLVEGVGLNVVGAAAATATPLLALGAFRVMLHADDRTGADDQPALVPERCDVVPPKVAPPGEVLA